MVIHEKRDDEARKRLESFLNREGNREEGGNLLQ